MPDTGGEGRNHAPGSPDGRLRTGSRSLGSPESPASRDTKQWLGEARYDKHQYIGHSNRLFKLNPKGMACISTCLSCSLFEMLRRAFVIFLGSFPSKNILWPILVNFHTGPCEFGSCRPDDHGTKAVGVLVILVMGIDSLLRVQFHSLSG